MSVIGKNIQMKNIQDQSGILYYNDVMTSVYLLLFVLYMYYSGLFLTMGHYDNICYVLPLAFLEVAKYIFYMFKNKTVSSRYTFRGFLKGILTVTILFVIIYIIAVLFGAPAFSNFQETFMFSLLLTCLTALPLCLYFGAEIGVSLFLSTNLTRDNEIRNLFIIKVRASTLGAWLGATVIPLDWNRPWQYWPIPCCVGIMLGYTVAVWICTFLQYKNRQNLIKKTEKYVL